MRRAALSRRIASRTGASSSARGSQRSRISGCSWLIASTRAPPRRIAGSSAACCRPSTVQSATKRLRRARRPPAQPADRLGRAGRTHRHRRRSAVASAARRGTAWRRVAAGASSASCGSTGRDCVSDSTAQASPGARRRARTPARTGRSTCLRCARGSQDLSEQVVAAGLEHERRHRRFDTRRTRPMNSRWSPASCWSMRVALEHRGAAGEHRQPARALAPTGRRRTCRGIAEAKRRDRSTCASASTLTAKRRRGSEGRQARARRAQRPQHQRRVERQRVERAGGQADGLRRRHRGR